MKKIAYFLGILVFSASCIGTGDVAPLDNCTNLTEDYMNKVTDFSSKPSKSSCEALVKSLDNLVTKCTLLSATEKKQYEDSLKEIDCSDF